jgi:N-acetylmuramoyl-L-alanine amidase
MSLGIELDNNGSEPFAKPQIDALLVLLEDLTRRYNIPRTQVLAHADVDPIRKQDPSGYFPWKLLAERGFGLWPDDTLVEPPVGFDPLLAMQLIGYSQKDPAATLRAFHLHYHHTESTELDDLDRRILFNLQIKRLGAPFPH